MLRKSLWDLLTNIDDCITWLGFDVQPLGVSFIAA